jgi:simple sugar transport system ATP-binding protein
VIDNVTIAALPGEVHCLLGDNGAGKSTLLNIMCGVLQPDSGDIYFDGERVTLESPRAARDRGVSTVYQHGDTLPLMSAGRNFFLGREPVKAWGPVKQFDRKRAEEIALRQILNVGVRRVTSGDQLVGTMSGGERQALSIARAMYFGARVLLLDEPTSALGVKEAGIVLELIQEAAKGGIAVVFITHNGQHALVVGDRFTILIQGYVATQFVRGERSASEVLELMAGGEELNALQRRVHVENGQ